MPTSKMKVEIARLLKEEGYIRDFTSTSAGTARTKGESTSIPWSST